MAVAAPPQFGVVPDADYESLSDSYLQCYALEHAVLVTRLSHTAAMYNDRMRVLDGWSEKRIRDEVAEFFFRHANMSFRQAQEHVRVAVALQDLPVVTEALSSGSITYQHAVYLTEFLTSETEAKFMEDINFQTLAQLRRMAAAAKLETRKDKKPAPPRSLRFTRRHGRPIAIFEGSEVDLTKLKAGVDHKANAEGVDPVLGEYRPLDERRGDALMDIVCGSIAEDADPDRASIVIHMTQEQFETQSGVVSVNGELMLFSDIADQVCDSRIRLMYFRDGLPMGVGRLMRDAPPAIRAYLSERDGGCRFPNCMNTIGLHAHHIQWWSLNGPTDVDNLIMLCSRHHHMIHDKGWTIHGDPNYHVEFRDPGGHVFTSRVPELKASVRDFANQILGDQIERLKLFEVT